MAAPVHIAALVATFVVVYLLSTGLRAAAALDDSAWPVRTATELRQCIGSAEMPWLAVYGDSLARGIFFDTVELFNTSTSAMQPASPPQHPGHAANYSSNCTLIERRPPLRRPKCGAFAFDASGHGTVHAAVLAATPSDAWPASSDLRLSFRLKTHTWEPEFDRPWLASLRHARRLPDVLLLSCGIWDMQYPPENDPSQGAAAFVTALRRFLVALDGAMRGSAQSRRWRRPRIFWLSVTAVADAKLPAWKRPRMSAAFARQYNALASPELKRAGIEVVDTFSSGVERPDLSIDGVHFAGALSRRHARLFWEAVCAARPQEQQRADEASRAASGIIHR